MPACCCINPIAPFLQQEQAYAFVPGMDALLQRLTAAGCTVHAFSNYPIWWRLIERRLRPSRLGLRWSFLSSHGPSLGLRKPEPQAFDAVLQALDAPPESVIFIDDTLANVEAANACKIQGLHFSSTRQLESDLARLLDVDRI